MKGYFYVYDLLYIIAGLVSLWCFRYAKEYLYIRSLHQYTTNWNFNGGNSICIVSLILGVCIFFIHYKKWRVAYFIFGSITLIYLIFVVGISGRLIRNGHEIKNNSVSNCDVELRAIKESYVKQHGCPNKYLTTKIRGVQTYSLNCKTKDITTVWENDLGKKNSEKRNSLSCLNMKCCNLLANLYAVWFYRCGFSLFGLGLVGFFLVVFAYFFSRK